MTATGSHRLSGLVRLLGSDECCHHFPPEATIDCACSNEERTHLAAPFEGQLGLPVSVESDRFRRQLWNGCQWSMMSGFCANLADKQIEQAGNGQGMMSRDKMNSQSSSSIGDAAGTSLCCILDHPLCGINGVVITLSSDIWHFS